MRPSASQPESGCDRGDRLHFVATNKRLHRLTRAAVTAVVLMMAVSADLMLSPDPTASAVDAKAIRVTSSNLITEPRYRPADGGPVAL